MKSRYTRSYFRALSFLFLLTLGLAQQGHGQQLIDDFTRANSNSVANGWTESETAASGAQISGNRLLTGSTTQGKEWVYRDASALYTTTLSSGSTTLTWAFNFRNTRADASGFDASNYGMAFVLGSTTNSPTTGDGYAVAIGQSGSTDPIRLVRFTNGMDANANLTNVISGGDYGTEYISVKVTYVPSTNTWALFAESNGAAFPQSNPTATATQIGSNTVNSTFTGSNLLYVGTYWNHATGAADNAVYDGIYFPGSVVTAPEIDIESPIGTSVSSGTSRASFGSFVTGTPNDFTFRVKNTGTASLGVTNITFSGGNTGDFSVQTSTSFTTTAGNQTDVTIRFTPGGTGTRSTTVRFANDDSDEPNYDITISGTGLPAGPSIGITGNSAAIGNGDASSVASTTNHTLFVTECVASGSNGRTYTITNSGTSAMTIGSITSNNGEYTIGALTPSGTIASGGGTATFTVTFDPATAGTRDAVITIASDAVNIPSFTFGIRGTGTATPAATVNTPTSSVTSPTAATLEGTAPTATCIGNLTDLGVIYSTNSGSALDLASVDNITVFKSNATGTYTAPQTISRGVTGLTPGTPYYYKAYATNAAGTGYTSQATFTTAKLEPTNHVSSLTNTGQTGTTLTFTWNDNDGAVVADNYLIRAAVAPATPTAPTDGNMYTTSLDFTIAHGVETATLSGLASSTQYNIAIYPYTNTGTLTDYKAGSAPTGSGTTLAVPVNLAQWELSAATGSQATSTGTVATNVSNVAPSGVLSRGAGATTVSGGGSMAATWGAVGNEAAAISANKYFEFSVTPVLGYKLDITTINFYLYRSSGGPLSNWSIYSSVNSYASAYATGSTSTSSAAALQTGSISGIANQTGTVTFRIYVYNVTAGTVRIGTSPTPSANDLEVVGYVTAAPAVPEINVTQAATTYLTGSSFDFGSNPVNTNLDKVFVIENNGLATLNMSSIVVAGVGNGTGYSLVGSPPTTVAAGSTANVTVRYNPSNSFNDDSATLTITHDDATGSENPYVINLFGTPTPSLASDIVIDGSFTYSTDINYKLFQAGPVTNTSTSVAVMGFTIRDGGGAADSDTLRTVLENITFNVTNIDNIRSAGLFRGNALITNLATLSSGTGTISFTGLSGDDVKAPDGSSKTLTLRVSFNATVTDNAQMQFTIASAGVSAAGNNTSSQFGSFSSVVSSTSTTRNQIEVTGDRLAFVTQPSGSVVQGTQFVISVQEEDSNHNRDQDISSGTVALTRQGGSGTLSGTVSGTLTAGFVTFTDLTLDVITTGVTIQAQVTPAIAVTSTILTNSFNVTGVNYAVGDYRTRTYGGQTTNWGTPANWEIYDGTTPFVTAGAAPDGATAVVHVERSMTMGNYGGANVRWTANKIYVKGTNTVLTTNSGTLPGLDMVGATGELRILSGKVSATNGIFMRNAIGSSAASTCALTVDSGATLSINYSCDNQSLIWNGVENFKRKSNLEILNWNWGTSAANRLVDEAGTLTVTANASGYKFGNIIMNAPPSSFFAFVHSSPTINLAENDITIVNASSNAGLNVSGANITIGGSLIVGSNFRLFASSTSGYPTVTIKGNIQVSGSAVLNVNSTSSGATHPVINLWGNYSSTGTSSFTSVDEGAILNFDGNKLHTVDQSTSTTTVNQNIKWYVTGNDSLRILNQDWLFNDSSALTVKNGAWMDFNRASNGGVINIAEVGTGTSTAFTVEAGGTIVIRNENGITTSGSSGNVQLDSRTYDVTANYHYKNRISGNQAVGSGFPLALSGKLIVELAGNADKLVLPASLALSAPGILEMRKGRITEGITGPTITGNGALTMFDGVLEFNRTGSSLFFPRLTGTYNLNGGTIQLSGVTNSGTNIQRLRGGETYYNVMISGTSVGAGYKTITSAVTIVNNLTIVGDQFTPLNNSVSGTAGLTITTGGVYTISSLSTTVPQLDASAAGASYNVTGGTIELIGSGSGNFQRLRGTYDNGPTTFNITYGTVLAKANAANYSGGNIRLTASVGVNTAFHVFAPAILDLSSTDVISGTGNFILDDLTGMRLANAGGLSASGATGAVQVTGTRTFSDDFYALTGAVTGMITGSGFPTTVDSLLMEHTGSDITLTNSITVPKGVKFAGSGNLVTGSNTVFLGGTGRLWSESATNNISGRVQSIKPVLQNATELFGNIGFEIKPTAASPGTVTVTRRTGAGSIQNGYGGSQSIARVYRVTATSNTGLGSFVTIKYFDSELNGILEPFLTMFRSEDMGVTWEKINSSFGNMATNSVSGSGVNAFSDWTLGDGSNPLPVSLLSFKGRLAGSSAVLTWQTAFETNNLGFEVQRSTDGKTFTKIGFVEASSPGSRTNGTYAFTDRQFPGQAYYRLKQLDRDGGSSQSPTILLDAKKGMQTEVSIYPNPASQGAMLQLTGLDGDLSISVTDIAGRKIAALQGTADEASAGFQTLSAGLRSGFYLVRVQAAEFSKTLKFEKK